MGHRVKSKDTVDRTSAQLPYLSYQPTIGRNSEFLGLSPAQKDELGGIEYRSLRLLVKVVARMFNATWLLSKGSNLWLNDEIVYYVLCHLLGAICLTAWIYNSDMKYREHLHSINVRPVWWYVSHSSFFVRRY